MAQAQPNQTNSTTTPLGRALMAERNGAYGDAATQYATILKTQPANVGALDRNGACAAATRSAGRVGAADRSGAGGGFHQHWQSSASPSARLWSRGFRTRRGSTPSGGRLARRMTTSRIANGSEAATQVRDLAQARVALDLGRQRLGPGALAIERAGLLQRAGDIAGAAQEWVAVVTDDAAIPRRCGRAAGAGDAGSSGRRCATCCSGMGRPKRTRCSACCWGAGVNRPKPSRWSGPRCRRYRRQPRRCLRALLDELRLRFDKPSRLATAATLEAIAAARVRHCGHCAR